MRSFIEAHGCTSPTVVFCKHNFGGLSLNKDSRPLCSDRKVSENGPPSKGHAKRLEAQFSLDSTPGILFYDNSKNGLVLEQEAYIDADYKEFRTPQMFLWKTYYAGAKKALDKLLAD